MSERLRNDKEVAMAAVMEDGRALQHVGSNMKKDRDILFAALRFRRFKFLHHLLSPTFR
jgi:hypothetical protein